MKTLTKNEIEHAQQKEPGTKRIDQILRGDAIGWSNVPAEVKEAIQTRVVSLKQDPDAARSVNSGAYTTRLATIDDAQALANLHYDAFPEYPYGELVFDKAYHERCCIDPNLIRAVITDSSGSIVAAGALEISSTELQAEVGQVVVHPDYRGNGLGKQLVEDITQIGKQMGLHRLYAHVRVRSRGMQMAFWDAGYDPKGVDEDGGMVPTVFHAVYHVEGTSMEPMLVMELQLVPKTEDVDKSEDQWVIDRKGVFHKLILKE